MESGILLNIFLGSLALSVVHFLIPNHWMPIVVMARSERWDQGRSLRIAALAGFSHTASSIIIGVAVGALGLKLTEVSKTAMELVAPVIFLIFGIMYILAGIRDNIRDHKHRHIHLEEATKKKTRAAVTAIVIAMFFSPCMEIDTYFFNASLAGWQGILIVLVTYLLVTVAGIIFMVRLGLKGVEAVKLQFLEQYEKHIMGFILILMALTFYVFLH
ncbi:MAG: hypothetical protein COA98_01250 [Candidatus Neomarinimicrobiota bacterium]|jgi:hypothetical protein|nr:MAG: hypothetical protein COA98_01250 [Candidatus Neomarinimicrobiota bacterium]